MTGNTRRLIGLALLFVALGFAYFNTH